MIVLMGPVASESLDESAVDQWHEIPDAPL